MAVSIAELRRRGYSADDIRLAQTMQEANRRAGAPLRSLAEVLAGQAARPRPAAQVEDLTARQLRRRGSYGQAALLVDQAALAEKDPNRAEKARYYANGLKALAERPVQLEFDFFGGGNVSLGHQYIDAVQARLMASTATPAERNAALATLLLITRHLGWQDYTCTKMAADLAELQGVKKQDMAETLALLEKVGAISRVKRGRAKIITVTPEGAFRGDVNRHVETVGRYRTEVVQLRPEPAA
ncbi:MAG: ArsR family transcriptional regulator [Gammaproteobacteria bacterium]|nr:ArsR family transcriptional regulator [Gammaproteobacteria bacterium]